MTDKVRLLLVSEVKSATFHGPFAVWAHFARPWLATDSDVFRCLLNGGARYVAISGMVEEETHDLIDDLIIGNFSELIITAEIKATPDGALDFMRTLCPGDICNDRIVVVFAEKIEEELVLAVQIKSLAEDHLE